MSVKRWWWLAGIVAALLAPGPAAAAVDVEARLSATTIEAGGTVQLLVEISDPRGAVPEPQFSLPTGLELLGSARSQQMSWVNGRSTNVTPSSSAIARMVRRVTPCRISLLRCRVTSRPSRVNLPKFAEILKIPNLVK